MPSPPFGALSGIRQIYACLGRPRRSSKSLQPCCKDSLRLSVTPPKRRKVELRSHPQKIPVSLREPDSQALSVTRPPLFRPEALQARQMVWLGRHPLALGVPALL